MLPYNNPQIHSHSIESIDMNSETSAEQVLLALTLNFVNETVIAILNSNFELVFNMLVIFNT